MADDSTNGQEKTPDEYHAEVAAELKRIQAYKQAVEEEFKNLDSDDPTITKRSRDRVIECVPSAAEGLAHLIRFGESESVRAGLIKFVFTTAMQLTAAGEENDLTKFLNSLTDPNSKKVISAD